MTNLTISDFVYTGTFGKTVPIIPNRIFAVFLIDDGTLTVAIEETAMKDDDNYNKVLTSWMFVRGFVLKTKLFAD